MTRITANEHHLWIVLHQVCNLMLKCEEIASSEAGLSREKYDVLMAIKFYNVVEETEVIETNLARVLYRSTNSISTIIDRMEAEGLIKKLRDLPDRRVIRLIVTPKAEKMLKKAAKPHMELIKRLCSVYTVKELQSSIELMEKFKQKATDESGLKKYRGEADLNNYPKMVEFLVQLNEGT
ncbi:MAG: MarR family transcriptional regulator [Dehalococcoidia bacterium]|jgi:MarR family 2-MHQ and catechol resistance regulon transcriptional repressor